MAMYQLFPMLTALEKANIPVVVIAETHYVHDGYFWHKLPVEEYDETMELIIDTLEEQIETITDERVEYETEHEDAGNNYAFLVRESYNGVPVDFTEYIEEHHEDLEKDDIREIYERIIEMDLYEMERGSIYGPYSRNGVSIDSFPVGEIECQIEPSELTVDCEDWLKHIALAWIAEHSRVVCVRYYCGKIAPYGNRTTWVERYRDILSYSNTDAVWFAMVPFETINDEVDEYRDSQ